MINPNDLWIGDRVTLIKSGRSGTYEGVSKDGRARVKIANKTILSHFNKLTIAPEEPLEDPLLSALEEKPITIKKKRVPTEIDLHVKDNDPTMSREPQMIIRYQLKKCADFILSSIDAGHKIITIIHGKGTGELRKEVHNMLAMSHDIRHYHLINEGGATEVWLN